MKKAIGIGVGVVVVAFIVLAACGWLATDYKSATRLRDALDDGENVIGQTALIEVKDYHFSQILWVFQPAKRMTFVSNTDMNLKNEKSYIFEITNVTPIADGYVIGYEIVD